MPVKKAEGPITACLLLSPAIFNPFHTDQNFCMLTQRKVVPPSEYNLLGTRIFHPPCKQHPGSFLSFYARGQRYSPVITNLSVLDKTFCLCISLYISPIVSTLRFTIEFDIEHKRVELKIGTIQWGASVEN